MSYTHKKVIWEKCANNPVGNIYGDITRSTPVNVIMRKQPKHEVVTSANGLEYISKSYYYADPAVEPNALSIAKMDKLDGEIVEDIYIMCDLYNRPKMVRFITI